MFFVIVRMTGPTFFSQLNYFIVPSGVGWAMMMLGERPNLRDPLIFFFDNLIYSRDDT